MKIPSRDDRKIKQVQIKLLKQLVEIERVCSDNNIQYTLHGGSLLGAIREKGFIPWDDDADIAMTRYNFERFKVIFPKESSSYRLITNGWVPRIVESSYVGAQDIGTDIFVYDFISERKFAMMSKLLLLKLIQGMMKARLDLQRFSFRHKMLLIGSYTFGRLFPMKLKLRWYEFVSKDFLTGRRLYVCRTNDSFKGVAEVFHRSLVSEFVRVPFEKSTVRLSIATRYHDILAKSYGEDYLTPPPIADRRPTHGR